MFYRHSLAWQLPSRTLRLGGRTLLFGILNCTPDSFSDGGRYASATAAIEHGLRLLDAGADVVDIGGESTRPGSPAGTADAIAGHEEQRRILPVIEGLLRLRPDAILSVDTYRAGTARAAILAGAQIVNDVSGLQWDEPMASTCAELRCGVVAMHTRGLPGAWLQQEPLAPAEVVPNVVDGLRGRLKLALAAGIQIDRMLLDPGFGFGKRGMENWALLAGLPQLACFGVPLLAGLSRKGFLSGFSGLEQSPADRDSATHTAGVAAILAGAHALRVHDVAGARRAADIADTLLSQATAVSQNESIAA